MSPVKQNIRVRFSEQGDVRFISHHDMMRLFERALRRADLPVAMSEGHNPRPRLSFPMALSVGHAGLNEVADVGLREWTRPDEFRVRLQAELPPGVRITSIEITPTKPSREARELAYHVPLLPEHCLTPQKVERFMAQEAFTVTRKRKDETRQVEVRQFVKALRLEGRSLHMLLSCTQRGTARPEEVMEALGCRDGADYRTSSIERTHVNLASAR